VSESNAPVLRVVNADATPEEIAAIVAVFAAVGSAAKAAPKPVPRWSANHVGMRMPYAHGRGGWRASSLPR
jgi:Ser/Thr protein kinase RdoA (MazF antagonist)